MMRPFLFVSGGAGCVSFINTDCRNVDVNLCIPFLACSLCPITCIISPLFSQALQRCIPGLGVYFATVHFLKSLIG